MTAKRTLQDRRMARTDAERPPEGVCGESGKYATKYKGQPKVILFVPQLRKRVDI